MQFFKEDENFSWRVLALESFVIMLSVFLGFMLNSWRVSASQEENVDTALRGIAAEMQHNMREMEERLQYYRSMQDTLEYLISINSREMPKNYNEIRGYQGLDIPVLRSSAFETAQSTGTFYTSNMTLPGGCSPIIES